MVNRPIVYTGALPQTVDILNDGKFGMFGIGYGMQMVLGTNIAVDGLACLPISPTPTLNVTVGVGSIYAVTQVDANPYSDLGIDTSSIVKQGINASVLNLAITPPSSGGFSQVYLVQAIYNDVDGGAQVLSYFNASNPAAPFSGPNNAGTPNYTVRQGICSVALKAGVAASTGTQVTPAPDAGYVGLYAITVANGATQVTSGNIVQLTTAPIVGAAQKLPQIPNSVQSGMWLYGTDTSIGGNIVTTGSTTGGASAVLTVGVGNVPAYMAAGLKVYDSSTPTAITGGQTVLSFNNGAGTITLTAVVNVTVGNGDTLVFSNDLFASTLSPIPAALVPGMAVRVKLNSGNVGASTFNANALGAVAIHRSGGAATSSGDLVAGMIAELVYDGSFWQIQNFLGLTSGATTNNYASSNLPYALDSSASSNTITTSPTPALPGAISAGQVLIVKLANPITGATTMSITGVAGSPFPVISFAGLPLSFGSASSGEMLWMLFDGTSFQIINPPQALQANLTIFVNSSIGNDSFDGSQATVSGTKGPLLHIQTAVNKAFNYPPSQFSITIQCADGTYPEAVSAGPIPGPAIIINGHAGAPSNVLVTGANNTHTFSVTGPNTMTVQNLKANASHTGAQNCAFLASTGGSMSTNNTVSGAVNYAVFEAYGPSTMTPGNHTFAGNSTFAFNAINNGYITLSSTNGNFTISTSITLTIFAAAGSNGNIGLTAGSQPTFTNPGNVTGTKFSATLNGVINTQGQGVNYFPGTVAGSTSLGGQYN